MSYIIMVAFAVIWLLVALIAESEIDKVMGAIISNIYIAGLFILTEINRKR